MMRCAVLLLRGNGIGIKLGAIGGGWTCTYALLAGIPRDSQNASINRVGNGIPLIKTQPYLSETKKDCPFPRKQSPISPFPPFPKKNRFPLTHPKNLTLSSTPLTAFSPGDPPVGFPNTICDFRLHVGGTPNMVSSRVSMSGL